MKKLRIDVEELQVESFEVETVPAGRGTVEARVPYTDPGWCPPSEDAYCSYGYGCTAAQYTCGGTNCQTYEGPYCYRWTGGGDTCNMGPCVEY